MNILEENKDSCSWGVYGKESREELLEGDELTPEEEGFMQGYMEA